MGDNSTEAADRFRAVSQELLSALGHKALDSVGSRVGGLTGKLEDMAGGGAVGKAVAHGAEALKDGESPVGGILKGAASGVGEKLTGGGGKKDGGKRPKVTTILEEIDVGVPLRVAYDQWTEFGQFPTFMKKVENVEAEDDTKLKWKAQIFWSHREWEATITDQIPDERIVWRSQGKKGHVDGAVSFHELAPNLTRIIVVLEYYPQGLMERTGNVWRAQGRRVRAELLHFRRHVMTNTILDPDQLEGWRGRIEDGEVVETHEDALQAEEEGDGVEDESADYDQDDYEDEPEDEYDDEPEEEDEPEGEEDPEDEYEDEPEEEDEGEEDPEDEYEDEPEEEDEPEGEAEDDEPEAEDRRARRPSRGRRRTSSHTERKAS